MSPSTSLLTASFTKHRFALHRQIVNFSPMKLPDVILFDDPAVRGNLLPFTFSRPIADIRIGIATICEKWQIATGRQPSVLTEPYLSKKFPLKKSAVNLLINASVLPDTGLLAEIHTLRNGECLMKEQTLIAAVSRTIPAASSLAEIVKKGKARQYKKEILQVNSPWDIFSLNEKALLLDFAMLAKGKSQAPGKNNQLLGSSIFIEKGAKISCAVLNSTTGPIYIGKNAEVMEGSMIRGPFALCEHSTVKMGAKIYGATTIGPHSKVGGEVNNSVIFGYSNKAHDGFLGNSVIGTWCNIGADTNNSNLKNNYGNVKVWHYPSASFVETGLQFCGLFMGDHSKCGINTMFNTGTVVGFSANVFGTGFPRQFVPSFSWGGAHGFSTYDFEKAWETGERMMLRRNMKMDAADREIWKNIFEQTELYRKKTGLD